MRIPSTTDLLMPSAARKHFEEVLDPADSIPTPLESWNRHCRDEGGGLGLAPGWFVIVGGGTGHGKSLLALNLAAGAVRQEFSPGFVSLEMSVSQLRSRLFAILTGTPITNLERGEAHDPTQADAVVSYLEDLRKRSGVSLFTNLEPLSQLDEVLDLMTAWKEEKGVRLFFVDYLQLIGFGDEDRLYREVTRISRAIRHFARKHLVTVVALSQFNRSTSANRSESPIPQSLIGSSSLENDADQVLLLDHSRYQREADGRSARSWAILAKNRHGGNGEIPVCWDYGTLQVREALPDEEHRWPGIERVGTR